MMMVGVLGEYLWGTIGTARHRLICFIEESVDSDLSSDTQHTKWERHLDA